jgi:probable F420-dependent oxidoreductase
MRVGFALPQSGAGTPELFLEVARRVEALGFDSLWVYDRLLHPVAPRAPYPGTPDGGLPDAFRHQWDPLGLLAFVAGHTRRVALGTSVLDIPHYNPVVLARQLTTLDVLSGGRLVVGLGLGWSPDELEAVGVPAGERGRRADEFIRVLKAMWTTDPVEFSGAYYRVPRSVVALKPVQRPHPPLYLAAYAPGALRRAGALADGWNVTGVPLAGMAAMMQQVREAAAAAGRDAAALRLVVRANLHVTERPLGPDRELFDGSAEQLREDVARVRALGADELFFDPVFGPDGASREAYLARLEWVRGLV